MIVGIDASRNRSGGAVAHMVGILSEGRPAACGITEVHVWAYRELLERIPDAPWLTKHNPNRLGRSLKAQLYWQAFELASEAKAAKCDVLLASDASTLCRYRPMAVLSQDLLAFEPNELRRLGFGIRGFRHRVLREVQRRALSTADGAIFLTEYAAKVIRSQTPNIAKWATIPHGVDPAFRLVRKTAHHRNHPSSPVKLLYVSNAAPYKHNWVVVRAAALLRREGCAVHLQLVGGGTGRALGLLKREIARVDAAGRFITCMPFTDHAQIPQLMASADVFVFASSCENMPVTLLEAMSAGLPIACSNRGPMPEVLGDAGVYFDPENHNSIAAAIKGLLTDSAVRNQIGTLAAVRADAYSWSRCAHETFTFLAALSKAERF